MSMQREHEGWPEGEAPRDEPQEESDGWFFDLPGGAWERQEAKNRELRRRILQNIEGQPQGPPSTMPLPVIMPTTGQPILANVW